MSVSESESPWLSVADEILPDRRFTPVVRPPITCSSGIVVSSHDSFHSVAYFMTQLCSRNFISAEQLLLQLLSSSTITWWPYHPFISVVSLSSSCLPRCLPLLFLCVVGD